MSHSDIAATALPPEIKRYIALHCSTALVLHLMLLQRSWYTACGSVLYIDVSTTHFSMSRTMKLLKVLVGRPDKALYVRRLCIGSDDLDEDDEEEEGNPLTLDADDRFEILVNALSNTQRLVHLVLPTGFPFGLAEKLLQSPVFRLQTLVLTVETYHDVYIPQLLADVLPGNPSVKTLGIRLGVQQKFTDEVYLNIIQALDPLAAAVSSRLFLEHERDVHVFPDSFTPTVKDWDGFFDDAMCTVHFGQEGETCDVHFHLVLNLASLSAASSKITASFAQACNKNAELELILQFVTTYRSTTELDYDAIWGCLSPLSHLLKQLNISVIYEPSVETPFGWRKPDIQISNLTRTEFGLCLQRDGCTKLRFIHLDGFAWELKWED